MKMLTESSNLNDLDSSTKADAIADLLTGDVEKVEDDVDVDEDADVEDQPESSESEEDDDPSEDSTDSEEEDGSDDSEDTWEAALGIEDGQLSFDESGAIKGFNVKVNGESSTVTTADLIRGYQNNKSFTMKSKALAEERKQFESQSEEFRNSFKNKLESADAMAKYLSDQLVDEFKSIDWETLRLENPAEYAAARQDYAARIAHIKEAQEAIRVEKEGVSKEEQSNRVKQHNSFVSQQRDLMLQNNPEWNDSNRFNSDMESIKSFLSNQYGFVDQDFASVVDARVIELIKDAKKFREGKSTVEKTFKKKVPKFQKSVGKSSKKANTKLDALTKKAKSAKGSQKRSLQTDAISELLLGDMK